MSRPLLITDCDEVLLHMVSHFADWLDEAHDVHFDLESGEFAGALTDRRTGETIEPEQVWLLLDGFFRGEMHRQTLVPGAAEALGENRRSGRHRHPHQPGRRGAWLAGRPAREPRHPSRSRVQPRRQGQPGEELVERHSPSAAVFIDDLAVHHASVAKHAPGVWRLHMIAEPRLAAVTPPAPDAHARIDHWPAVCEWILGKFEEAK